MISTNSINNPMTIATAINLNTIVSQFLSRYGLTSVDFVWTCDLGIDSYSLYAKSPDSSLTAVNHGFDYSNDEHEADVREMILAVVNNADWNQYNVTEIGGTISTDEDGEFTFDGQVISQNKHYINC